MHPKHTSQDYMTDSRSGIHAHFADLSPTDITPCISSVSDLMNDYISKQQLIRMSINRGRGVSLSIPCRILRFDSDSELVTVYHVDEKQVYTFKMNEIEDLVTSN